MMKTGIFYGSTTGTTREVAEIIAKRLGIDAADVHDVAKSAPSAVGGYDLLICGASTWGDGEAQTDWLDFLDGMDMIDLKGKKVALFGCGDETMSDTFCSGVGELYKRLKHTGAEFVGSYPADVYHFHHSDAIVDGAPVGLLLDQVNHPDLTSGRIDGWLLTLND
ncbi:MAG: flavodoxin [Bacteroides sp.]|nr:flavodoxin [Bacteroides sp.]MBD5363612.1 flavodoxin [Bacteroides sp.]